MTNSIIIEILLPRALSSKTQPSLHPYSCCIWTVYDPDNGEHNRSLDQNSGVASAAPGWKGVVHRRGLSCDVQRRRTSRVSRKCADFVKRGLREVA